MTLAENHTAIKKIKKKVDWIPGIRPGTWLWISSIGFISYWMHTL